MVRGTGNRMKQIKKAHVSFTNTLSDHIVEHHKLNCAKRK